MNRKNNLIPELLDITEFLGGGGGNPDPLAEALDRKFSSLEVWKRFRQLSGLAAWKHFQKLRSLEVWQLRPAVKPVSYIGRKAYGLEKQTRRLSWDFIGPDFIKNLVPYCPSALLPQSLAFTMAEILISLTIIGIIAAITLPSLRANINEKTWATQRKALYSRLSQAISMLPSLNGYGIVMNENGTVNYAETNSKAAMAFVTDGLGKVLKINNICDNTNLIKCGLSNKLTNLRNSKINFPTNLTELNPMFTSTYVNSSNQSFTNPQKDINTNVVAFETSNGESIAVFYNPFCQSNIKGAGTHYAQPKMCANFIYDLNGQKGPNKVGKDIGFITALYPTDSNVIAPMPLEKDAKNGLATTMLQTVAASACRAQNKNSRLPNIDELTAMFYNMQLIGISSGIYWSSSVVSESLAGYQYFVIGYRGETGRLSNLFNVRCIKR